MKEPEEQFSNLNLKEKILVISAISLLILLPFALIFFVYVGVFHLTGVEYTSRTVLLLFFILLTVLDLFTSFGINSCKLFFKATLNSMPKWLSFLLLAMLEISFDWITFHIADEWIDDVTISNTAELLIVLFFFILDKIWLTDKKEK
ncbi:YrvL family regulatory protein [Bacillus cereus group sp. BfR-BA-01380]|uniref:YrvL family regulatory protein n=1 Tax=Bacillus cereus group sp. BfR-BA-01380 TaxID=2920324 RepID=UPI001F5ABBF1|nr:YrvL family regulatory protein [Bacillus cereus group sp. BfR-BA-01380]